jgi:diguanylate cyclase (GGDEF)-like protein/PAS domain S-box-containing protein
MKKVAKGDLRTRVEAGAKDEVGELADSFNQLVESLKNHVSRDEEYSRILEEKVEERTRDLKESMMELRMTKSATLNMLEDVNKAKEELMQAKEYIESLVNCIVDPMVTTDSRGIITFLNEGAERSLGYRSEEMVGKCHISVCYRDGKEGTKRIKRLMEKEGKIENCEITLLSKYGKEISFLVSVSFLRDAEGKITGTLGIARDISEAKRLEGELRQTRDFLENIIESSTDAIVTTGLDGKITFANSGTERMFGHGKGDAIGTHISQYYAGGLEEAKRIGKIVKKEGRLHFGELDFVKKDRTTITLSMSYDLLRDNEGRTIGIVAIGKDVTEKKRMEVELRKTKDFLESVIEESVDGITTLDNKGNVTLASKGAEEMLGYKRGTILGTHISKHYVGGMEEAKKIMKLVRKEGNLRNYETALVTKDSRTVPISVSVSFLRDDKGEIISSLGIYKDITENKRLQKELEKLSITDNLTGLYNQRHFYNELKRELNRAKRLNRPLSLLLFDVDELKHYNDTYGHLEGDKILHEVGKVVANSIRGNVDSGYRYGGDEFVVVLPETDKDQALPVAERIRTYFSAGILGDVTLSMGLVEYRLEYDMETFVRYADNAMYTAKRLGGDRITIH